MNYYITSEEDKNLKIQISEETAMMHKKKPFEAEIDRVRVSERESGCGYSVRISILENGRCGREEGGFDNTGKECPGDVFTIESTKLLIQALQDCIEAVENK